MNKSINFMTLKNDKKTLIIYNSNTFVSILVFGRYLGHLESNSSDSQAAASYAFGVLVRIMESGDQQRWVKFLTDID